MCQFYFQNSHTLSAINGVRLPTGNRLCYYDDPLGFTTMVHLPEISLLVTFSVSFIENIMILIACVCVGISLAPSNDFDIQNPKSTTPIF